MNAVLSKKNLACLIKGYEEHYTRFILSSNTVEKTQKLKLLEIINKNKNSEFGKKYSFSLIKSIKQFQENVPVSNYEAYESYIQKISAKNSSVLTSEKIILFEPTSGSTSSPKLIPYTESLKHEFMAGIGPWLYSIYKYHPKALSGKQYWSITPIINTGKQKYKSGIKIGFENDGDYLGVNDSTAKEIFVVPTDIKYVTDLESFKYLTQLFLIKERNLSLISIWNPSMMQVLFEDLAKNIPSLCEDIAYGKFKNSLILSSRIKTSLLKNFSADKKRAEELRALYKKSVDDKDFFYKLFPDLKLISCWTHGSAKLSMDYIKNNFLKSKIQSKGLIATEGIVSIPFNNLKYPVVSILSHFFEFLELDKDLFPTGKVFLTNQLKLNKQYCVLITTSGGLYRYNLNDIIRVRGFFNEIPEIEFIGKLNNISDIVGEKLHESQVKNSIIKIFKKHSIEPKFIMLAPEKENDELFYTLYIESKFTKGITVDLEKELLKNYHYSYCRKIGQLKPLRIFFINSNGSIDYLKKLNLSMQLGNIKTAFLNKNLGWSKVFKGSYLK